MKKVFVMLLSSLWGLLVFRIALGIHFPMTELSNTLQSSVEKSTNKNMQLDIGEMGLSNLIGVSLSNATLYQKDAQSQDMKPFIIVDEGSVSLNPLSLMSGGLNEVWWPTSYRAKSMPIF